MTIKNKGHSFLIVLIPLENDRDKNGSTLSFVLKSNHICGKCKCIQTKEIASHSVTSTVIMSRKTGDQVWLFSCCQHAVRPANTGSRATKEISLARAAKLFIAFAKKVSVRKADGEQCHSRRAPHRFSQRIMLNKCQTMQAWWWLNTKKPQEEIQVIWKTGTNMSIILLTTHEPVLPTNSFLFLLL